jgi:GNAT superfamily N-acetyltransferase
LIKAIYTASFEDDERMPFDELWQWLKNQRGDFVATLGAFVAGEDVVGMGSAIYFANRNIGYLVYLAVREDLRGYGYGREIVQYLVSWIRRSASEMAGISPPVIFWEVRNPGDAPDETEKVHRQGRIKFYASLGAQVLPVAYTCPPVQPGQPEVNYLLMVLADPPEIGRAHV